MFVEHEVVGLDHDALWAADGQHAEADCICYYWLLWFIILIGSKRVIAQRFIFSDIWSRIIYL